MGDPTVSDEVVNVANPFIHRTGTDQSSAVETLHRPEILVVVLQRGAAPESVLRHSPAGGDDRGKADQFALDVPGRLL